MRGAPELVYQSSRGLDPRCRLVAKPLEPLLYLVKHNLVNAGHPGRHFVVFIADRPRTCQTAPEVIELPARDRA